MNTPTRPTTSTTGTPSPRSARQRLRIDDICTDLGIARSTFYDWRAKGRGPRCIKLPNGDIRINHTEYERWLNTLEEAA